MTKPKEQTTCRTCGKPNDNDARHPSTGWRVQVCKACDKKRKAAQQERHSRVAHAPYARMLTSVKCQFCQTAFLALTHNQKFCSRECRNLDLSNYRKRARRALNAPIECRMCGKQFLRANGQARYCSDECRRDVKRRDAWINHLRSRYRITNDQFEAMREACGNQCQVCGTPFSERGDIHIDHDHGCCPGSFTCGKCVRGMTCKNCNFMLGHAGDDPDRLRQGIAYLELYGERPRQRARSRR